MLDFLLLRRIMIFQNTLQPIEHRYFIAFLINNVVYILGGILNFTKLNKCSNMSKLLNKYLLYIYKSIKRVKFKHGN